MKLKLTLILVLLLAVACTQYSYEVCNESKCNRKTFTPIQPTLETITYCNPNWLADQARQECEEVPINLLLGKSGTNKPYCNKSPYLASDYLDNWWNAEGLIDECEMPVDANMQFIFKMHDGSLKEYTGIIQIRIDAINYNEDFKALQIYIGEYNTNNWVYCGNVDGISGYSTKYILCNGTNIQFIKVANAPWNKGSIFIDNIEILKYD